ncbi:MAG TPA: hypothetical protein VHC22_21925 [Pirellulales bacterium]|nr:hypothetical protein [Pirellulales bacterium]
MPKNLEIVDQIRGYEFWREGCAALIANVCEVLKLAEMQVEPETIIRFVGSIELFLGSLKVAEKPDCFCDTCFRAAFELTEGKDSQRRLKELMDYFAIYLDDRTWVARMMLIDSVIGVVSGLENGFSKKG